MRLSKIYLFCFFVFIAITQIEQKASAMPSECSENLNVCGYHFCDNLPQLEKKYKKRYGLDQKYKKWQKQRKWCTGENNSAGILEIKNAEIQKLCDEDAMICHKRYTITDGLDCEEITTTTRSEVKKICLENNDFKIADACEKISELGYVNRDSCTTILLHKGELRHDKIKMQLFEIIIKNIRASKDID
jgi:hypothetical protein